MAIPPFPSQDLAKLVLGYLAEEQLVTVYDEFLRKSPYLDALQNEFDCIMMTSLKSIVAEYRALKIYIHTCKPLNLRKKLLQYENLLDALKYLVVHADVESVFGEKLAHDNASPDTQNVSGNISLKTICNFCGTAEKCQCRYQRTLWDSQELRSSMESQPSLVIDTMVETTSLTDLPGNSNKTRRSSKSTQINFASPAVAQNNNTSFKQTGEQLNSFQSNTSFTKGTQMVSNLGGSCQNKNELCKVFNVTNERRDNYKQTYNIKHSMALGSFRQFSTGLGGSSEIDASEVTPNSSTPESSTTYIDHIHKLTVPLSENSNDSKREGSPVNSARLINNFAKKPIVYLQKLKEDSRDSHSDSKSFVSTDKLHMNTNKLHLEDNFSKKDNHKVSIISNIRVTQANESNKLVGNTRKLIPNLQNDHTYLTKMQTIFVNGTPAYKPEQSHTYRFTKDEIMAMPTIIIVPASDVSTNSTDSKIKSQTTSNCVSSSFEPLTVDVHTSNTITSSMPVLTETKSTPILSNYNENYNLLDNAMLHANCPAVEACIDGPKAATDCKLAKVKTPQVSLPPRKSSSTPRRTSHVRVLDFTTPRRLLQTEVIPESVTAPSTSESSEVQSVPVSNDVNDDKNPSNNLKLSTDPTMKSENTIMPSNDNHKPVAPKKRNWDADLRVLTVSNEISEEFKKSKPKSNKSKNKKDIHKPLASNESGKKPKSSSSKRKSKNKNVEKICDNDNKNSVQTVDIVSDVCKIKPTINIITDWNTQNSKTDKKPDADEVQVNTPESEHLSIQNAIGSKLNISEFLETPYKQALYDIQMETPRFIDSNIPDEPLSEIKIMNIPTPKFFDSTILPVTPKPVTPSSYVSRPTDYSSGSSYYKPDDHDYLLLPEALKKSPKFLATQSNADNDKRKVKNKKLNIANVNTARPQRPVRQCARNVSYVDNLSNKSKSSDATTHNYLSSLSNDSSSSSSCSCDLNDDKNGDLKNGEHVNPVDDKEKSKTATKNIKGIKRSQFKKRKTPVKKIISKSPAKQTSRKSISSSNKRRISILSKDKRKINQNTQIIDTNRLSTTHSSVPTLTKSRRKSSTPRKLHCSDKFTSRNLNSSSDEPPRKVLNHNAFPAVESYTEAPPLHRSDGDFQDAKYISVTESKSAAQNNESDDIMKIKEYIEKTATSNECYKSQTETLLVIKDNKMGSLKDDLVKRGFDVETAKILERDLLDTPPDHNRRDVNSLKIVSLSAPSDASNNENISSENVSKSDLSDKVEERDTSNKLQIDESQPELEDEIEFSAYECCKGSHDYLEVKYNTKSTTTDISLVKLKDKFSMEVCIEDGLSIRLRATPFIHLFEDCYSVPDETAKSPLCKTAHNTSLDRVETEKAVESIILKDNLYTPQKQMSMTVEERCIEIFDSTLTSIDTPLKSGQHSESVMQEVVLKVESTESTDNNNYCGKKRKRVQSNSVDESNDGKKSRPQSQYLANIQEFDIESVLSKLHGP